MELSPEDSLRLNVLLAQELHAIRIDDSNMIVYALSARGDAKVQLNPNCKDDKYVKLVKELFSTHALGSPGGYPIYLRRWTRMGQARSDNLSKLLLLGEPEAVVAVVHAPGISDEIARRAWWAMPSSENARRMLSREAVANAEIGKELADFLVEFMPFEEDPIAMMDSVRLVLQRPGLISNEVRESVWKKAKRKNAFYVGYLASLPDDLPEQEAPHRDYERLKEQMSALVEAGNAIAIQLLRSHSAAGQSYLHTVETVLKKPSNQDVVVVLFDTVRDYFSGIRPFDGYVQQMEQLKALLESTMDSPSIELKEVLEVVPEQKQNIEDMLMLSLIGERLLAPIFAITDAVGSVMRKKIEPVALPIQASLERLRQ